MQNTAKRPEIHTKTDKTDRKEKTNIKKQI
jgi:hypothetical protein